MADISKKIQALYQEQRMLKKLIEQAGDFSDKQDQFLRFNEIEHDILALRNYEWLDEFHE